MTIDYPIGLEGVASKITPDDFALSSSDHNVGEVLKVLPCANVEGYQDLSKNKLEQTSLLAFENNVKKFSKNEEIVFDVIKKFPGLNNREIAESLGWPVNCVTGRVYSLRKKGVVIFAGVKIDSVTHQKTDTWRSD